MLTLLRNLYLWQIIPFSGSSTWTQEGWTDRPGHLEGDARQEDPERLDKNIEILNILKKSVEGDEHPKNVAMGGEGPDGLGGRPAS